MIRKIQLTESQFNKLVNQCVKQSLNELNLLQKFSNKFLGTNYKDTKTNTTHSKNTKNSRPRPTANSQENDYNVGAKLAMEYWNARVRGDEGVASRAYNEMLKASSAVKDAFQSKIGDLQQALLANRYKPSLGY